MNRNEILQMLTNMLKALFKKLKYKVFWLGDATLCFS